MWFASQKHKDAFYTYRNHVTQSTEMYDLYYDSALYVLSFLRSEGKEGIDAYLGTYRISFALIIADVDLSSGQLSLVRLAANCFNDNNPADVAETFSNLSGDYARVALQAIKHRYLSS